MLTSDAYIGSDVLTNEKIARLTEMTELLISYVSLWLLKKSSYPQKSTPDRISKQNWAMSSSLKILFRNHQCIHSSRRFDTLHVAKYITTLLLEKQGNASQSYRSSNINLAAIGIREAIQRTENKIS